MGISPAPGFIRTFSLVTEQVGWRREKRIGAVYDYLDLIVGGRFVSWDSILFLMMDWKLTGEIERRLLIDLSCFSLVVRIIVGWWIHMVPILFGRFVVVERHFLRVVHACWLAIESSLELLYRMESCPSTRSHRIIGTEISLISKWM